jgi:hypothetical protein
LTRLLADLADQTGRAPMTAAPPPGLAAGLGAWLDWTQAIALSAVLGDTSAKLPGAGGADPAVLRSATQAVRQVREARRLAITTDTVLTGPPAADFEDCRHRFRVHQQAMATATSTLRAQLRTALASATPAGARLAALDGVMATALAAREGHLLAGVIERLEALQALELTDRGPTVQAVLLAELETRLQPAEGLLAALGEAVVEGHAAKN